MKLISKIKNINGQDKWISTTFLGLTQPKLKKKKNILNFLDKQFKQKNM